MKKIFLALSISIISLISLIACKNNKKDTEFQSNVNSTTQKSDTVSNKKIFSTETLDIDEAKNVEVPKFSDPEVQKYVEDYDDYVDEYLNAAKEKDITKLEQLGKKAQEWNIKQQPIIQKLASNPEELRKYNDYILKLANKMTAVMIEP